MSERKDMMQDLAEAYVLGGLEEAEMAEFETYLHNNIDEQQRVAALRDTVGLLASTAAPVSPPTGMKSRILANVLSGSKSASGSDMEMTEASGDQPAERSESITGNAGVLGNPADGQEKTKVSGADAIAARDGKVRAEDTGLDLLPEQARQGIEAGEARRAAQARGIETSVSEPRAGEANAESVRMAREAARARGGRGLWAGAAAAMAAAAVLLGVYSAQLRGELNDMHQDMAAMQQQTTALAQHASDMEQRAADMEKQLASASQPAVGAEVDRTVALAGSKEDPKAWGTASMVRDDKGVHLLVQAADLPQLSGNEAYQLWLIKDGTPINAGTFKSDSGSGALSYTMQPGDYDMVVITLEPDAEGDKPRGRQVLLGALNG